MSYTTAEQAAGMGARHRRPRRRVVLALAAVAGVTVAAGTFAGVTVAHAGTDGYPRPDRAVCERHAPRAGRIPFARELGASGITWQYVTARMVRQLHVSPCSVVIGGYDDSVIMNPRGRIVATS